MLKSYIILLVKSICLEIILSMLLVISVRAQNNTSSVSNDIIPPPPNAAALTAYHDIQVGLYSGKPDITLDLLKLNAGEFSVPVSLQYDPSSLKVSSYASRSGFGWTLNCGGVITRSIVGLPDELTSKGFNSSHTQLPASDPRPVRPLTALIKNIRDGVLDGEADIYSYSLLQQGGHFVNTGEGYYPQPNSGIKIEKISGTTSVMAFKITDEKGYQYFFQDAEETQYSLSDREGFAPTSWYLSKIITPNATDSLLFSYDDQVYSFSADYSETLYEQTTIGLGLSPSYQNQSQIIYGKVLRSIKSSVGTLKFFYSDRLDCEDKKLDQVVLLDQTEQVVLKKVTFQYDYFLENSQATKLRLLSYSIGDENGLDEVYRFSYTGNTFPPSNSKAQDHWGYYNGRNNGSWIPWHLNALGIYVAGADKETNSQALQSGLLKRIQYPTGGFTEFQFEPNEFSRTIVGGGPDGADYELIDANESLSGNNSAANMIEKNMTIDFQQPVIITYRIGNCREGDIGTVCHSPAALPPSTSLKLILLETNSVVTTFNSNLSNQIKTGNITQSLNKGNYKLVVETPDDFDFGTIQVIYKKYDFTKPKKKWIGGGIRVKSIVTGDGANPNRDIVKTYDYSDWIDSGKSSGQLVNKPKYTHKYTLYNASTPRPGFFPTCEINPMSYNVWSSYPGNITALSAGNYVFYTKAIERTSGNGEIRYEYQEDNVYQQVNVPPLRVITKPWKENLISRKTYYSNALQLLKEEKFEYQFDTIANRIPVRCVRVCPAVDCPVDALNSIGEFETNAVYFDSYFYTFEQLKYQSRMVTEYNGGNPITSVQKSWFEDAFANLTKEESVDSKGRTNRTIYTYADSYMQISPAYSQMKIRNMIGIPIEKITYKENILNNDFAVIMKEKYNFNLWNNDSQVALSSIQRSYGNLPLEDDLFINQYDGHGNITEQQRPGGIKEVYLWGYKSKYAVAKITGSTYNQVSGLINQNYLDNPVSEDALRIYLDLQLRRALPDAHVSTFTYKPLFGISSQTDEKGQIIYYEYDNLQRLKNVMDQNKNILKNVIYHYMQ